MGILNTKCKEWNMNFKYAASTAQEVAYSEEKACEAAKFVVDLSNAKIFLREGSTLYILVYLYLLLDFSFIMCSLYTLV